MVKLPAKTLVETLVAMVIISTVIALWSQVYLRLAAQPTLAQEQCGRRLLQEATMSPIIGNHIVDCDHHEWTILIEKTKDSGLYIRVELAHQTPPIYYQAYAQEQD